MAAPAANMSYSPKRLIVCCDGTWMNSYVTKSISPA